MYENIGRKIKGLATTMFVIMAILYGIVGIVMMATAAEAGVIVGLLVMVGGFFLSWIGSWLLYGFGELIEKTCEIERNTRRNNPTYVQNNYNARSDNTDYATDQAKTVNVPSERFARLQALRDKGIITEEEYQKAISIEE